MPLEPSLLRNSLLFAGLTDEQLKGLSALTRLITLRPNQTLFCQNDKPDGCYALIEGTVKVSILSSGGDEALLAILGEGDIIGEMGMIDGERRSATISALKKCKVAFLPAAGFRRFADDNPSVYQHMLTILSKRLRASNDRLAAQQMLPLSGRLARLFLKLSDGFGQPLDGGRMLIKQTFTQSDLARMTGSARENVNRQINQWQRKAIVSRISRYYCLDDLDTLRDLAEF
ncbi:cAMP-activated global transcriptional regulator CRP [bacterium MnTg02]|nr:cAMP-activated global transcriptional regulator CRP [bacterium MnTg02]